MAGEYASNLIQQVRDEGAQLFEGQAVHSCLVCDDGMLSTVTGERVYHSKTVILATGMGQMEPRRLGVEGEYELAGKDLVYAVNRVQDFAGQRVLVVGGGDAAVDNALLLSRLASDVTLAHRGSDFKAQKRNLDQLPINGVRVLTNMRVSSLQRFGSGLRARLQTSDSPVELSIDVDRVVVNVGLVPNPGPLAEWGLKLEGKLISVDSEMKTSLPGVFACGDAVTYPGKLKMVVTAVGEAATAVNTGFRFLQARGQL
jgi:thioredoxin reductase (NADPH)